MLYGDGDGKTFTNFSKSIDVVAHELAHGITESSAKLVYAGHSGALNESWSDVFGELAQQWVKNPDKFADPEYTKSQDWQIGEDVFTPSTPGDALRSMKNPGTAYPGDDQPANMRDYVNLPIDSQNDWGGVHTNSGIPNKAAYEAGVKIGGEKLAKVWYKALTEYLKPTSDFNDGALATIRAAKELYKDSPDVSQAVKDAWISVGVDPANPVPAPKLPANLGMQQMQGFNDGIVPPKLRTITK